MWRWVQAFQNPKRALRSGLAFIVSYYLVSIISIACDTPAYNGLWQKNGAVDIATSVIYFTATAMLLLSFSEFLTRHQLGLGDVLMFYILFVFLFAFMYRLLEWHFPGMLGKEYEGWSAELAALNVSMGAMTGRDMGLARPAQPLTQMVAAFEGLMGLLFVAVLIGRAVKNQTAEKPEGKA